MFVRSIALIASALILTACGGGGYDGPPSSPPPPPTGGNGLVITQSNAQAVAGIAYTAAKQSGRAADLVASTGIASSPGDLFSKPGGASSPASALAAIVQRIPLGPDVYDCVVDGTVTISGNLAELFTLTAGDDITVVSDACDDDTGEVITGTIDFVVDTFSGSLLTGLYLLIMDVDLVDFEVTTAADTIMSNGDSEVTIDTTGTPMMSRSVSGMSVTGAGLQRSVTITGFSSAQTVDTSVQPEPYTFAASGTFDSSDLGGTVDYATPVTFQGMGAEYPFAGELLITGANGTSIRLIANDNVNVTIEVDSDGNGNVDLSIPTTWDDLTP